MPDSKPQRPDDAHEKARDLGEKALEDLAQGREKDADRHIEQAKRLDEGALRELVQDLDEDAGANPDAVKDAVGGRRAARPPARPGQRYQRCCCAQASRSRCSSQLSRRHSSCRRRAWRSRRRHSAARQRSYSRRRRSFSYQPGGGGGCATAVPAREQPGPPRRTGRAAGRDGWPGRCGSAARRRQGTARGPDAAAHQRPGADIAAGQRADAGARPGAQQAARDGAAAGGLAAGGQGQQQQGGDCSPCHVFLRGSYRSGTRQDPAGPPDCVHFVLRQRPSDVRNRPRSTPARDGRLARKQRRAEKSAKPARPAVTTCSILRAMVRMKRVPYIECVICGD